jgi:GGDEF domain-containing protein
MTTVKRSLAWAAVYLAVIFILAQTDYLSSPIVDFASYFYLTVIIALPVTLLFPSIAKVPVYVPLLAWAGIYMVLLQTLDRSKSAIEGEFSVIILEFVLLELGVWLAYQLAVQISNAESIMDALALSTFPNRAHDIESEERTIKAELTRSRRYHRPLSLVVVESDPDETRATKEMFKNIQNDLLYRFTAARVGQIIDERIRQTDLVMRDHSSRFVILCPETDLENATLLAQRITLSIRERTDLQIYWGAASFPDDALTFEDLLHKARARSEQKDAITDGQPVISS